MVVMFYFVFVLVVSMIGSTKKIGGGTAFFVSLLLTPVIGLILVLLSADKPKPKPVDKSEKLKQIETIKDLKEKGVPVETIANLTKIDIETIKSI